MAKQKEGVDKRTARKMIRSTEGCAKSITLERNNKSDDVQLHDLPNDILGSILSRLTFRESSQMGLVSHTWRRLWRSCCRKLVFTSATMFQPGNRSIKHTRTNFAMRVNSFLRQLRTHPTLNKFVIKFGLRRKHTRHVNRWIRFCSVSRARHITINFTPGVKDFFMGPANSKYIFPLNVFSGPEGSSTHVRTLHLGYVCLDTTSSDFMIFANLKKLTLHKISFLGDLQCLMLPECNSLECLSISFCSLPGLSTCQPLQRLRCVRLHYCYLKKIELEAPNLTSFDLTNQPIPFVLGGSLNVMEANIKLLAKDSPYGDNLDYIYTELPAALSHVHKLSITSGLFVYDQLQGFSKTSARFINLRHLTMYLPLYGEPKSISGILRLAYLLELAPALEELELHVNGGGVDVGWALRRNMLPYSHNRLKRVLISGATVWEGLMELAYYILRSANRLESMVLDPKIRIGGPQLDGWMIDIGRETIKNIFEGEEFQSIITIL
ncbi:F-box/FBD/LRR-repeat protein At1g13570 isoform X1 [Zea mays]|uniref:SKP1-like protein 4 n=3 Tax=Zea mays TaxID=4577 RepID=A0A1D6DUD1_MAIZE|nr:F-box/FBD/LRR-repeat protein At1g13570 isoform X1 [Zea mays]XP_035821034.1 F-box/FBD/LRR-repeat protein At1g13570 isoform X1 [Zea mays]ONM12444.1 SKP1-like protein 4 [Zea mays]ONM12449.1 SKP1-like protein 4 [Zea mays]ONM12451.1 SKP1-like protein 4 [Zea mays]ONM12456.1 SKP1-like protein 4 [Zea mays]ONM12458.1 SKP1-like protein 4 [Zea mays]|eukprot:XP_023157350.1 F-box/FBD/LRR-repeat protein At1g13570-like isoform X1 [Zea mays]